MSTHEDDDRRSFSSWKFDMLNGIVFDPRIRPPVLKLIAIRILQAVNQDTGVAWISDETIADEVPIGDRKQCYKARKLLKQLGWWEVEPGHGAYSSQYRFKDTNLNWILDEIVIWREARREERKRRKLEFRERKAERREVVETPPPRGGHMTTADEVVIRPRRPEDVVRTPHKNEVNVAKSPRTNVAGLPPVHLHITPSVSRLSGEDVSGSDSPYVHAREGSEPLVYPPTRFVSDASDKLLLMVGRDSFTRGADVKKAMGPSFDRWVQTWVERGLTASDVAAIKAEAAEAMERSRS